MAKVPIGRIVSGVTVSRRGLGNGVAKGGKKSFEEKDPFNPTSQSATTSTPIKPKFRPDYSYSTIRGTFVLLDDEDRYLNFQFNPEELSDSKEVTYEDRSKTGFDNTDYIWVNGGSRTITFTLQLDASEASRVRHLGKSGNSNPTGGDLDTHDPNMGTLKQVEFLQSLQRPLFPSTETPRFIRNGAVPSKQFAAPPEITFVYGSLYLIGVIASLGITHKAWSRNLRPLQSEASVTFKVLEGRTININPNVTKLAGVTNI
jgi:hypothetical protein